MRLVKKVTAAAMASAMALSLAACGGETPLQQQQLPKQQRD